VCNDLDSTIPASSQDNTGEPLDEPTVRAEEVIHGRRSRAKYEKSEYVKRMNDRTAIINSLQAQNEVILTLGRESSTDEIDLFFRSIAISVNKLPPRGQTEAKLSVLSLVAQLEDKYLGDTHANAPVLRRLLLKDLSHICSINKSITNNYNYLYLNICMNIIIIIQRHL